MNIIDKKILKLLSASGDVNYRLLCIPYAGGGASFFCPWRKIANKNMDIIPVQLPGHEERFGEMFLTDIHNAAVKIVDAFEIQYNDKPFSVFGHSMGGLIGYETVKEFEKRGINPDFFFVSATSIENFGNFVKSTELNDDDFLKRVMMFGGIDKNSEALKYNEFFKIYLKVLRADFNMIENYNNDGIKIKAPICAMCGNNDPMENKKKMQKWENLTKSEYMFREFFGDHFYLKNQPEKVFSTITYILSEKVLNK